MQTIPERVNALISLSGAATCDRCLQEELGLDGIVAELNPGGLIPAELETRSLELLTHKVMPAFK